MVEQIYRADGFFCGPPGEWNLNGVVSSTHPELNSIQNFQGGLGHREMFWKWSKQAVYTIPPCKSSATFQVVIFQHFITEWLEKACSEILEKGCFSFLTFCHTSFFSL